MTDDDRMLDTELDGLQASDAVRRLVRELGERHQILADRRGSYLSLRPAPIGAIAVYAHAHKVSIAVEPLKAQALILAGAVLQRATPATTYVVIGDSDIGASYAAVSELADSAVYWRANGPAMTLASGRGGGAGTEADLCPDCGWYEIAANGTCWCVE